ncbi:DUF397 domain-containing protein [Streptomyces dioscori]|uniref:DUF397 domain-containing protein n=1 Tax=Streptomyces dioscori TaxID=2109333 RepID=A0A2P8QC44_9ACTN|nr:DUF397 domain-containing protein [Streptomyces dioscori]PSM43822.1 DUF397 domain-containing protein [Streptomyces dioscori]
MSSLSSQSGSACVYIATPTTGTILLRESDAPEIILTTGPRQLAALIRILGIGQRQNHSYD